MINNSLRRTILVLGLLGAVALSGCSVINNESNEENNLSPVVQSQDGITVEGSVAPADDASLYFAISGEVVQLLVKENETVAKGDILARLGDREGFDARVMAAQLELVSARQAVDDLQSNSALARGQALIDLAIAERSYADAQEALDKIDTEEYQDKIDDARSSAADAQKELEDAEEEFKKYADLAEDHPSRKTVKDALNTAQDKYNQLVRDRDRLIIDLDQARAALDLTNARVEDARSRSAALADGPDPDDLVLANTRLDNAMAQLSAAQADQKKLELLAPFDGTIARIDIAPGERVVPSQVIMVIADFSSWYIETNDLTENEVVSIKIGQNASLIPNALPEVEMAGTVDNISNTFQDKGGDITYRVRLLLPEPDPLLRWGMTVEVRFDKFSP